MGGYLRANPSKRAEAYLSDLHAKGLALLAAPGRGLDVQAVFEASYQTLTATQQVVFRALSVMPADFDEAAGVAVIQGSDRSALSSAPRSDPYTEALHALVRLNLLEFVEATERFKWHDLLHKFAGAKLGEHADDVRAALQAHAAYFTGVADIAKNWYVEGQVMAGLKLFDRERSHIEAAFKNLTDLGDPQSLVGLVDATAYTRSLRFHPSQSIVWLQAQLEAARSVKQKAAESTALTNLATCIAQLGQPQRAIELYEQALLIDREISNRLGESYDLAGMASCYAELDQPQRAIEMYEQTLSIAHEIGDHKAEAISSWHLGNEYLKQGELARAIALMQMLVDYEREIDHPSAEKHASEAAALLEYLITVAPGDAAKPVMTVK